MASALMSRSAAASRNRAIYGFRNILSSIGTLVLMSVNLLVIVAVGVTTWMAASTFMPFMSVYSSA